MANDTTKTTHLQRIKNSLMISTIVVTLVIFFFEWNLNIKSLEYADTQAELIANSKIFTDASAYLTTEVRSYIATGDETHVENYWQEVNGAQNRELGITNMIKLGLTQEEKALISQMRSISNDLVVFEEEAMALLASGDHEAALEIVFGSYYDSQLLVIAELENEFNEAISVRTQDLIDTASKQGLILQVVLCILLLVLAAIQTIAESIISKKIVLERTAEIQKTNAKLRALSERDPLTNAYNRLYFEDQIEHTIDEYNRTRTIVKAIHLCIFDLDNFKKINDTFGHAEGDLQLIEVVAIINKLVGKEISLARIGGEEFTLLFINETDQSVLNITEQIRLAFERLSKKESRTTGSFGIAKSYKHVTRKTLFQAADRCLYHAKNTGKNKIVYNFNGTEKDFNGTM